LFLLSLTSKEVPFHFDVWSRNHTAIPHIDAAFEKPMQEDGLEENDSQGYALFPDPEMHAVQLRFPALAEKHLTILSDVLRNSSDAADRT